MNSGSHPWDNSGLRSRRLARLHARIVLLVVCFVGPAIAWAEQRSAPRPDVAAFSTLLGERFAAVANADAKAYAALVAPEAVFVDDYGVQENATRHIETIGKRRVGYSRYTFDDLVVTPEQGVVLVTYHAVEHVRFGPREHDTAYRMVETYVERDGKWLIRSHAEAQVAVAPPPQKVAVPTLQDYVGRYEWWPGFVDTITRDGDQLYSQTTDEQQRTLNYAATPESFYFAGEPNLVVFARDRRGHVTHYLLHWSDGAVTIARKIK